MTRIEELRGAIEIAEHKPGDWARNPMAMGSVCTAEEARNWSLAPELIKGFAGFSYKRDGWLAESAVNALPALLAVCEAAKAYFSDHNEANARALYAALAQWEKQ